MQTFYISMARDLLGVFIEVQAESQAAVHAYLEREYLTPSGEWKLPWCAVYSTLPVQRLECVPVFIVKAQCGPLHNPTARPGASAEGSSNDRTDNLASA